MTSNSPIAFSLFYRWACQIPLYHDSPIPALCHEKQMKILSHYFSFPNSSSSHETSYYLALRDKQCQLLLDYRSSFVRSHTSRQPDRGFRKTTPFSPLSEVSSLRNNYLQYYSEDIYYPAICPNHWFLI